MRENFGTGEAGSCTRAPVEGAEDRSRHNGAYRVIPQQGSEERGGVMVVKKLDHQDKEKNIPSILLHGNRETKIFPLRGR